MCAASFQINNNKVVEIRDHTVKNAHNTRNIFIVNVQSVDIFLSRDSIFFIARTASTWGSDGLIKSPKSLYCNLNGVAAASDIPFSRA